MHFQVSRLAAPLEDEMQKFHMGDLVRVAKDLGESMSHFSSGM